MDMYRAFLAIIISFFILIGYQYFFIKPAVQQPVSQEQVTQQVDPGSQPRQEAPSSTVEQPFVEPVVQAVKVDPAARNIRIETPLYTAVINEQGGGFKSFVLTKFRKEMEENSGHMELVQTTLPTELPLLFYPGKDMDQGLPIYRTDKEEIILEEGSNKTSLTMTATVAGQMELTRTLVFDPASYVIAVSYQLKNITPGNVTTSPSLSLTNQPFIQAKKASAASRFMFSGPVALVNGELAEVKGKKLGDGPQTLQGDVSWSAYEDTYFICAVIPGGGGNRVVRMSANGDTVRSVIGEETVTIEPGGQREFTYEIYFGPKKLSILNEVNYNLSSAINFGWFDVLAKPMLWLLNFFHSVIGNYGIAIILLTVLIKGVFWPITQKGMKSMKNMQKLQPKVAKLKEKYKDDSQKMNQEMMALYKTYKVNPLGGCLPMVLQIPFFFALYKVLLMSIELRHAPFMLWINDLSAPDRLWIGFDIPYLHGIPVLTLLMGASMYLQQKMTPTTADPTQARIMQMLPIIFTFMFLNFASGLVLYWFVNNLLSILQQQMINRQTRA
jgi:YidC/Oxa1 family membrane protein insertase